MEKTEFHNRVQDRRLENMDKHIEIINGELGSVKTDMASCKTDMAWIKKFFWIIATSSIGGLIAQLFNISI